MKDKSTTRLNTTHQRKESEMLIYEAKGINLVDVYHLITTQLQLINTQSKIIKELETNSELRKQIDRLKEELDYERNFPYVDD